ncbi:4369_t:CDS:2, partial [Dentiscutata heterogama]
MSLESGGQNKSINENLTKETSTSTLQDTIITSTPIVQQSPTIFHKSPVIISQKSQVPNSRIPTFKNAQPKTTSSTVIKSSVKKDDSKDSYDNEKETQNTFEFSENVQKNNLNDLGGDVSNLSHLNGGTLNLSESSGIVSSAGNSAGVDIGTSGSTSSTTSTSGTTTSISPPFSPIPEIPLSESPLIGTSDTSKKSRNTFQFQSQSVGLATGHLRRWHSSHSGLHYTKSTTFGKSDSENDDIRTIYERWKLRLPKDDLIFDQFSSCVDRLEKKEAERSLKWASWVSSNKFVKKSGKFGCSSYVFPWDKKMLLTLPSQHEKQIDLDIPRTLHSHIMFRSRYGPGQRALFNILRAFSNYNTQIGYCQGMTNIVTILLMYYTEENAFIMLTKLFTKCNLHNLFIPGFPALLESFYVQEKLLLKYTPKIASQFNKIQLTTTAYATRWYITLFTSDVVPHHTVLRIWDLLMLHGFDILYFVAVALLKYHKAKLITSSFEHTMLMLSTTLVITNDDRLIKKVKKMFDYKGRKGLIDTLKA